MHENYYTKRIVCCILTIVDFFSQNGAAWKISYRGVGILDLRFLNLTMKRQNDRGILTAAFGDKVVLPVLSFVIPRSFDSPTVPTNFQWLAPPPPPSFLPGGPRRGGRCRSLLR